MESKDLNADYVYLIINDLNGTADLSDKDVKEIMELTEKKKSFNFFYIGTDKLKMFQKYKEDINVDEEDMSIGEIIWEGDRLNYYGMWSDSDNKYIDKNPNLLYQSVIECVVECIKSNEGKND